MRTLEQDELHNHSVCIDNSEQYSQFIPASLLLTSKTLSFLIIDSRKPISH